MATFFDALDWIEDRRKSPEANSSRLTKSPLPRLFALIHSFGNETITVEPPVTCSFLKSFLLEFNQISPEICDKYGTYIEGLYIKHISIY